MSRSLSQVNVGVQGHEEASKRLASGHAMGSAMETRGSVARPVLTENVRKGVVSLSRVRGTETRVLIRCIREVSPVTGTLPERPVRPVGEAQRPSLDLSKLQI